MFFEHENFVTNVSQKDMIPCMKAQYECKMYHFYWNYTHDVNYLKKYFYSLKTYLIEKDIILKKYLSSIDSLTYSLDIVNKRIYYTF